jgi:stage V sporulation protein R
MDYKLSDLEVWDDRILEIAAKHNLDPFPIEYEFIDYYSMMAAMAFHGMPTHYNHWSFGKSFERTHRMYDLGAEGLPYELIINANPSVAYMMRENPLYLQILIMAHCVGHSDFFKNNRTFKGTRPDTIVGRSRAAKKRFQSYVESQHIGIDKVEQVIDACHAIQFQCSRPGWIRQTREEIVQNYIDAKAQDPEGTTDLDINANPLKPDYDVLAFISENAKLPTWKKDIIDVCRDEGQYFWPQIQTKIMNEGWASYWHYTILHELNLPPELHVPFIKSHNQVIRPHIGGINPYHLGFHLFQRIKERHGIEECFIAREVHRDSAFLQQYLTREDCEDLNLFSYSEKKSGSVTIDDVSDEEGWKHVRNDLVNSVSGGGIPVLRVQSTGRNGSMHIMHEHDGRDLQLDEAKATLKHLTCLWGNSVSLETIVGSNIQRIDADI